MTQLGAQLAAAGAQQGVVKVFQQVVRNGFGLALGDADAAAAAAQLMASGVDSWPKLLALAASKQGGIFDVLGARADGALAFDAAMNAAGKGALTETAAAADAVRALLQSIGASPQSVANAATGLAQLAGRIGPSGLASKAVDGYLKGATVFADTNGNHKLDAGELSTTTDASGGFTIPGGVTGPLVVVGGTDLLANTPFKCMLGALPGATVVNPVTTMLESLVSRGKAATVEQAMAKLAAALKLPANIDPLTYDPLAVLANDKASAADKQVALAYEKVNAKLANIVSVAAAAVDAARKVPLAPSKALAAPAGQDSSLDDVIGSLADKLDAAGGSADLSDANLIRDVVGDAAQDLGVPLQDKDLASISSVIDAANDAVDSAGDIGRLGQTRAVSTDAADALGSGNFEAAASGFTGANFESAVTQAEAGQIADGVEAGTGGTCASSPAPAPAPGTAPVES
jgi:hypothetical protein